MIHLPVNPGISGWRGILSARQAHKQLDENLNADYLVIGAGFAGLSAARRLNQLQPDAKIVVLEACEVSEGPAGRNSGFMIDLPHDLSSDDYLGSVLLIDLQLNLQKVLPKSIKCLQKHYNKSAKPMQLQPLKV